MPGHGPFGMAQAGRFTIAHDHPALPGHFPGEPIAPGVVLLDEALALLVAARPGWRVGGIAAAKFSASVGPGETVEVSVGAGTARCALECSAAGRTVMRATVTLVEVAS